MPWPRRSRIEPPVEVGVDEVPRQGPGQEDHIGVESGAERDPVELIGCVSGQRATVDADDLDALAAAPVVHVDAVGCAGVDRSQGQRLALDEAAQDAARFAAQRAAENDLCTERRGQARDPEALAAGVQMHLGGIGSTLDRDRQQRRWREHRDPPAVLAERGGVRGDACAPGLREPASHIASATIRRSGSASDGADANVKRECASCREPS